MAEIVVTGGGAAGMMAAARAAACGNHVTLLERNEKLGKKIYITGKGRCNLTNNCETEEFFDHVSRNPKFLYSAVYSFDKDAVRKFFEDQGVPLKVERGNRVFPVSDHASDITGALQKYLQKKRVAVLLNADVEEVITEDGRACGVYYRQKGERGRKRIDADAVILAAGGCSYPQTGSDGSMFEICRKLGHTVTPLRPSLVPMNTKEEYITQMQGLSLKNVTLTISSGKKKLFQDFGEMMFTHFGITGPLVLTASSLIPDRYFQKELQMSIDLKPALSFDQLDRRIQRDFAENSNRQFKNSLHHLLPARMIPVVIELSGIDPETKVNVVTREKRHDLVRLLKNFPGTIVGLRGYQEAIITRGGVSVKEVDPSTMESRLLPGLYLCGEMLDLDAVTGGFNLQIAWSTGWLAGDSAGRQENSFV